ncbi:MAG: tetratricopeptide repeat protein, partial [Planctomycetes bacterium]|nr:tetratricopeptide repeat protein [Planctomycetota bacterium]
LGQSRAADVRWDLWAVGVCLFEALALRRPFDEPTLDGLYRAILTRDAPPLRAVTSDVPKDLAAVVAVCLEKTPERRYQSAADLAADLRAVRRGEAIRVRPPGIWRRLVRWHVRNAAIATAVWLLLASLCVVIGVQRAMLREVTGARDEAQSINDFFVERMLLASTPEEARGKEPTAGQVLDAATDNAAGAFPTATRTAGMVYHVLGRAHHGLSRRPQARAAFERAVAIRREVLGPDDRDTLRSRYELARVLRETDELGPAGDEIRAVLQRQTDLFGAEDADTLDSRFELSRLLGVNGKNADAEAEVRTVIAGRLRALSAEDPKVLDARVALGRVLMKLGKRGDAETIFREVLAVRRRTDGADSVAVQQSLNELSNLLRDRASFERLDAKWAEAEEVFEESVALARKLYKSPDSALATPLNNFGVYWQDRARLAKSPAEAADCTQRAAALFRESLAMREESDGPDSKRVAIVRNNLGMLYLQQKMYTEALVEFDRAIAIRERIDGPEHSDTLGYLQNRAHVLQRRDGPDAAVDVFAEALSRAGKRTDRDPRFVAMIEGSWLRCLLASSRSAEGLPVAEEVYQRTVKFWSAGSREAQVLAGLVAKALRAAGRDGEAGEWDERAKPPAAKGQ